MTFIGKKDHTKNNVCAIIVSYNGKMRLQQTISALRCQVGHIVVVDNHSSDDTILFLNALEDKDLTAIYNPENMGVGYALNQGIQYARQYNYRWLLTMDQDSIADEDMVGRLLACAKEHINDATVVSFSPMIIYKNSISPTGNHNNEERYTVITSGNLVDMEAYKTVGVYNDKLFIDSVDFDFCLRLRKSKLKIIRCHRAKLLHALGMPEKHKIFGIEFVPLNHSFVRKYYISRNNIYILRKYMISFPLFCIRKQIGMIAMLIDVILFEEDKIKKIKFMIKGTIDGVLNNYLKTDENLLVTESVDEA